MPRGALGLLLTLVAIVEQLVMPDAGSTDEPRVEQSGENWWRFALSASGWVLQLGETAIPRSQASALPTGVEGSPQSISTRATVSVA